MTPEQIRQRALDLKAATNNEKAAALLEQAAQLLRGSSEQQHESFAAFMAEKRKSREKKFEAFSKSVSDLRSGNGDIETAGWSKVAYIQQVKETRYNHSKMPGWVLCVAEGKFRVYYKNVLKVEPTLISTVGQYSKANNLENWLYTFKKENNL